VNRPLRTLALAAALTMVAASLAAAEPKTFDFDKAHTEIGFNIRHFFTKVHGRFNDYTGTLVYDPANLTASTVEMAIKDSSIYTANERRDSHLRTQDFFWMEKYPLVSFKSTKVMPGKDASHFQVAGNLTIRDVTKPVTLDVEFLGMGPASIGGNSFGTQAGFTATTTVKRQDWGIIWNKTLDAGGVMLGDDVDIVLNVAAFAREKPAGAPPAAAEKK
jgi:polyisoprenoid-binding protein YceI